MYEFRVAVDKAGIKSYDYYANQELAEKRYFKLKPVYRGTGKVCVQKREVGEWKDVPSGEV